MSTISFVVPGIPVAKGRPRITKGGRAYTPSKTRKAEDTFAARCVQHAPAEPWKGPVQLAVAFYLPQPKGWPAWKRDLGPDYRHVGRPDLDNLVKLVADAMNGLFWADDSQVYRIEAAKCYGPSPATRVIVSLLPENPTRKP